MKNLVLFLCLLAVVACKPEIKEPEGEILKIQEITTKKGISIWLVEDKLHPIIAMRFTFQGAGAINETVKTQGTARLLSNTMDEGAGDLDSQAFQKELSDHSITLRFSSDRDDFGGSLKTLNRHQDKAFDLLKLSVSNPRFDEEPLARMKQANISRIQSAKGEPDWIRSRLSNDIFYKDHPYALNAGGTISTLKNITVDHLRAYHKTQLTKDRLVISIVGNIDAKTAAEKVDAIFESLPNGEKSDAPQSFDIKNQGQTFIYDKDIPQSLVTVALPGIEKIDPDYYTFKVMNIIFGGGGFGSRLMEEAREKRGLTYGIYSSMVHKKYTNEFIVSVSTKNESAQEMVTLIRDEMIKMVEGASEEEIEKAKAYLNGSLSLSLTSTDQISSIVQQMNLYHHIHYLDDYNDLINAVTKDDVIRVAKRILKPEAMVTIIVGQPENIENFKSLDSLPNVE